MTQPGVLSEAFGHGWAAWAALRLAPARALRDHRGYVDLPEAQRRAEAAAAESAWLAAQCVPRGRFELRYTSEGGLLRAVLLARAVGADQQGAARAALGLRTRLAALPAHVRAVPVEDLAEVRAALNALNRDGRPPATVGLREIGKPVTGWPINRPDSTRAYALTAPRLGSESRSWEQVWAALARQEVPTTLSVCLAPVQLPPGTDTVFRRFAAEYERLASPAAGNPVWGGALRGDPSAEYGRAFFADALRRYLGPCYRFRVSLAVAGPVPPGLAELVADRIGGAVLAPESHERDIAWRNLTGLGLDPLPDTYRQGIGAGHWTEIEHVLAGLADRHEAATAFRLPYEIPGHLALFAEPPTAPAPERVTAPADGRGAVDPDRPVY